MYGSNVIIIVLVKTKKLWSFLCCQYWYSNDSIIADSSLRRMLFVLFDGTQIKLYDTCIIHAHTVVLMQLLFQLTEVEFELSVEQSSFLDETWVIPVFKQIQLPPIKTLDLKLR